MTSTNRKTCRLLIVDPTARLETLVREGYGGFFPLSITRKASGSEALKKIARVFPDMILSDFYTDDMKGTDIFVSLIRDPRFSRFSQIPFVLFSDPETKTRFAEGFLSQGLSGWYSFPFGAHEMREVIDNLILTHDVSESNRKLVQEIKRSQYRYRDLLENANDFIFMLDNRGRFEFLNNRFIPLTGWKKEQWLTKPFASLVSPAERAMTRENYRMARQGKARVFEVSVLTASGHPVILSISITPILEGGQVVGSIGIGRDVTEQKTMENEILDLKNFNESIIQSMEAGLLTTDLNERITSINAGARRTLGWDENVLGREIRSLLDSRVVDVLLSNPPKPDLFPYSRELEMTVKDGKKIVIGFTTTNRVNNENKKVGNIVSFRDITQLKQMQSEVIRMDRLASLGVLASGIAHEIKNPLAGIKTLAQTCEDEFEKNDPRREYLLRIVRQVNRLDDLLKTFFAFARPKPPDRQPHALSEILHEVVDLVSKKLNDSRIRYSERFGPNIPDVLVDSQQIQQVFLNLILNAIEAMPSGGELRIFVRQTKRSPTGRIRPNRWQTPQEPSVLVETSVSDSGIGIEPDKLQTIFDPFFTTKPNGIGLGLSIVYRILGEHHGDIRVESRLGQGTTVTVSLPAGV